MRSNSSPPTLSPTGPGSTYQRILTLHARSERDKCQLFLAEGFRSFQKAKASPYAIEQIVVCRALLPPSGLREVLAFARSNGNHPIDLKVDDFNRISLAAEPSGVLIVLRQRLSNLPKTVHRKDLWLGIEQIRTPGNLGTLLRSAAAFGARGLMLFGPPRDRSDPFDPLCVRASMGAIFDLEIIATNHREFRRWPRRFEVRSIGADPNAPTPVHRIDLRKPTLLMLGNERSGLSEGQLASCDLRARIPIASHTDSLNVAMAGTAMLYETARQRLIGRNR